MIICHGGPGSTHNYLELLDPLAESGNRPLVYYDQFGCGLSSFPEEPDAYAPEGWIDELEKIRSYFGLRPCFLLGHSWGGMLIQLYLKEKSQIGVKGIVLSSTLCSSAQWSEQTHILCRKLSDEDQKAILEAERSGHYDCSSFQRASEHYLKLTVSDIDYDKIDLPECLSRKKKSGSISYLHCWGPSEFTPLGLLKNYDTRGFLPSIQCPSLILFGDKDESNEIQNQTMFQLIGSKDKSIHCFKGSRHMTYYEAHQEYLETVAKFLKSCD